MITIGTYHCIEVYRKRGQTERMNEIMEKCTDFKIYFYCFDVFYGKILQYNSKYCNVFRRNTKIVSAINNKRKYFVQKKEDN